MAKGNDGDYSNSGIMYRNDEKDSEHPNWADFKGSINVTEPGEYWLSGWVKDGKKGGKLEGKKFFSLSFQPKEQRERGGGDKAKSESKPAPAAPSNDIPF